MAQSYRRRRPDDPSAGGRIPGIIGRMATLSRSDVEHVAHLARLGLTDAELTRLEGELNHILDQYAILAELPTDDIPPTAQTIELENILREDVVRAVAARSRRSSPTRRRATATSSSSRPSSTSADRPMTDPTRLLAHEMAALLRSGDVSSRELTEAHLAAAERDNHGAQRLADDRSRAGARRGRRRRRPTGRRPDRPGARARPRSGRCSASRSRSRTSCPSRAASAPPARASSRATARRTTRTSPSGCARPARSSWARPTWTSSRWARRPSTRRTARRPTRGRSTACRAAAAAARRRRSRPTTRRSSIGTDTGGSIRQPAALCGIVGMKPTYGRVSRYGIVAFASSLDQIGPFARDARDAAALLHAVAGRDDRDSTSSPEPVPGDADRAAVRRRRGGRPRCVASASACPASTSWPGMEPGVEARVREAVAALEAAGAIVEEVSLPHTDYGLATYYIVAPGRGIGEPRPLRRHPLRAAARATATSWPTTSRPAASGFGPEVKRRIMLGTYALSAGYYDAYYLKAQKVRTLIKGDFDALWAQGFDALVAPTSPTVAFRFGARLADPVSMYLSDACTLPVNMAGLPGVSIPCGLSEGLPVGSPAHRRRLVGGGAVRPGARLRGDHRGRRVARRIEPAELALAADPKTPDACRADGRAGRAPRRPVARGLAVAPAARDHVLADMGHAAAQVCRPAIFGRDGTGPRSGSRTTISMEVTYAHAHRDRRGGHRDHRRDRHRPCRSAAWRTWGIDPARGEQAARRATSSSRRRRAIETRGDHHRRAARGRLAVARPDGLRPRRLVQLRPARHAWQERDEDRARSTRPSRSATSMPTSPDDRVRGQRSSSPVAPWSCSATRRCVERQAASRRGRRRRSASDTCRRASPRPAHSCGRTPQEFAASWAFSLEPLDGGRTRLIERFRVRFDGAGPAFRSDRPGHGLRRLRDGAAPDARHPRAALSGRRSLRALDDAEVRPSERTGPAPRRPIGRAEASSSRRTRSVLGQARPA